MSRLVHNFLKGDDKAFLFQQHKLKLITFIRRISLVEFGVMVLNYSVYKKTINIQVQN